MPTEKPTPRARPERKGLGVDSHPASRPVRLRGALLAPGAERLRRAVRRLGSLLLPAAQAPNGRAPAGGGRPAARPAPRSAWERTAERRLAVLERQLNHQNRMLLLAVVGIAADLLYGLTR